MKTIRNLFTRISTFWNDFRTGLFFQRKQRAEALQELRAQVEEPKKDEEPLQPEPEPLPQPHEEHEPEEEVFDVWNPPNLPDSFVWDDIPTRADMEAAADEMRAVHIAQVRRGQAMQRLIVDLANIMADSARRVRGLMLEMENM